ncbi:uncharacterized protein SAPINGB_P005722 [Magnusiomyces paraingens]|uniref:Branched-chain-amino-acid transaminase n=1 Tax=Magnusiomyces paraingens TaxID=2606893 RepID=A0A5E8C683_9ASCO|nr:uncharacterized protein SAPINGB_P005722 [Saprochaete ingens]VVT57491.1 unnamed protein product [Saprochaete ingens]
MSAENKHFNFYDLVITETTTPKALDKLPPNSITDHMLEIDWTVEKGWGTPQIKPVEPLALDPTSSCLHYATQCFEGLKVFRSRDGKTVRLLRPELNLARLNDSAQRLTLPQFDEQELLKILLKFVSLEARFIKPGSFIYTRPFILGTSTGLGLNATTMAKLIVVLTLMPSLSDKSLKLYSSEPTEAVRAWPTGFGSKKLGANYGPTLKQQLRASADGYDQVLWLYGEQERLVTEAGGSNFMAVLRNKINGNIEIVTCPLDTNLILPGINRRSALEYLRERELDTGVKVLEKRFSIDDLEEAMVEGRLQEAFAIGTAYFVAAVGEIRTPEGKTIHVPVLQTGIVNDLQKHFEDIMYGSKDHPWTVVVLKEK